MFVKKIGQVRFELKADFDFSFLAEYGEPFVVFDQQDSGNLCFGVHGENGRFFLKLAGAETARSNTSPDKAIERLRACIAVYRDLRHPLLMNLEEHREVPRGYLHVYRWFDGECMGKQYGSRERLLALPPAEKLAIYRDILEFHRHVNERGYIALDFYDGCIMYDFETRETRLCDIECYRKKPVINDMGRMWGSTRFMSPEEFELGAEIDERSNVYLMGATAFNVFGGELDRSLGKWELSERLHGVASKAVNREKDSRHQSIREYIHSWNECCQL